MNIWGIIMNGRQVIPIYECEDLFLYEIIEDYKDAKTQDEKDDIFRSFCSSIWSCDNKRRIYTKAITYKVQKELLPTALGQVFDTWSSVEYKHYKTMTKEENWRALVRQKINNLYTRYFDKEVILDKQYMDLLKTPKRLYYEWALGMDMDADTVTELIDDAIDRAEKTKAKLQAQKMVLSWQEYKKTIESFLLNCLDHCKRIEEYEDKAAIVSRLDFLTEDHFYVSYICRSLEGEFLKWQKKYYHIKEHKKYARCTTCGAMIEKNANRQLYCAPCAIQARKASWKKASHKYRHKPVIH